MYSRQSVPFLHVLVQIDCPHDSQSPTLCPSSLMRRFVATSSGVLRRSRVHLRLTPARALANHGLTHPVAAAVNNH